MNGEMNLTKVVIDQIKEIDARDENQIMSELAGETVQEMFYTVDILDKKAKRWAKKPKLSWSGTKEAARSRGNIVVDNEPTITDLDDSVRIVVRVTDLTRNLSIFGGCHQPKKMKVNETDPKTGAIIGFRYEEDPFYFQKALSKAQRNGFQIILPADYIAKCLNRFMSIANRKAIKPPENGNAIPQPTKKELKAQSGWESITKEMVPDYPHLERIFWDITKKQPAEMYKELGVSSRSDISTPAWESFLQLREVFALKPETVSA
jgi:hypothetical protein